MKLITRNKLTGRGFQIIKFQDRYKQKCSIQQSSLADFEPPGTSALWIGLESDMNGVEIANARMHLDLEQVKELIPIFQKWVDEGVLY